MIKKVNENLAKYTTIKIGGCASVLFMPESVEELVELVKDKGMLPIISGGSNLLINDKRVFAEVIYLGKIDQTIKQMSDGMYYIGSSVRLQKIINTINADGFGGIEFLFSVPGMLGGAVYMNAGRGSDKKCISDCIKDVYVIDKNGNQIILSKDECHFDYRKSVFQKSEYVIIGATMSFFKQDIEISKRLIKERFDICNEYQDNKSPNFGSVFCLYNVRIMDFIKKYSHLLFKNKKARFSQKTCNWIVNDGNGTFEEATSCIRFVERVHRLFHKRHELEVKIWK